MPPGWASREEWTCPAGFWPTLIVTAYLSVSFFLGIRRINTDDLPARGHQVHMICCSIVQPEASFQARQSQSNKESGDHKRQCAWWAAIVQDRDDAQGEVGEGVEL